MNTDTVLVACLLVAGFALISGPIKASPFTPAMVFVIVGVLVGPDVLGIFDLGAGVSGFKALAELALTLLLFLQASRLDFKDVKAGLARRLVFVALPLTIAVGTLGALLVFPELSFWEAACLAIVVAPIEAALVPQLVSDSRVPGPVRRAFSVESGLSDGVGLGLLLIALALASEHNESGAFELASFLGKSLGMSLVAGAAVGAIGGWLLVSSRKAGLVTELWSQLYLIALAIVSFVVVEHLDGSGFVGAFGAGLAFAAVVPKGVEREEGTAEVACELVEYVVFAFFGAGAVWPAFDGVQIEVLLYAVLALALFRLIGVAIATARAGLSKATILYVGWFGPRGLTSLLFGFLVLEEGVLNNIPLLTDTVVVTVTLSVFLHGLTARWGTKRYAEALIQTKPDAPEIAAAAPAS